MVAAVVMFTVGCGTPVDAPDGEIVSSTSDEADSTDSSATVPSAPIQPAEPWAQFRGPGGNSTSAVALPEKWGVNTGIRYIQGLPGRGASTPIFFGDQIFLTAYSGYGLSAKNPGDPTKLEHHLIALERDSGKPIWMRTVKGTSLKQRMNPELARHGFASSTPATDGENVYAFFGVTGVYAFKNDGTPLWQRNVGLGTNYFGSSASPVLYENLCIVNASIESNTIYAFDKQTGVAAWKIDDVQESWSMPVIGKNSAGDDEMIVSSKNEVNAYDPTSGKRLWTCPGIMDYVVSVPIIDDGICYLTGGKQKQTMAIRMGDVPEEDRKIWEIPQLGSNVSSPIFKDGRLYIFHDSGVIQIINAADGKLITRHRSGTKQRPFASPLLAGDNFYMAFQDNGIEVLAADKKAERVSLTKAVDDAALMASLIPIGNHFIFRSDKYVCCVGPEPTKTTKTKWMQPKDHSVIEIKDHFNIDPANGRTRRYLTALGSDFEKVAEHLMIPYNSVITEEQTKKGRERILEDEPQYKALRKKLSQLRWEEATAPIENVAALNAKWEALEAETLKLSGLSRIKVKKLFSEEQMEKHIADAKEKKAHIKPK